MSDRRDTTDWTEEIRTRFDSDELSSFFEGFAPLELPTDEDLYGPGESEREAA